MYKFMLNRTGHASQLLCNRAERQIHRLSLSLSHEFLSLSLLASQYTCIHVNVLPGREEN